MASLDNDQMDRSSVDTKDQLDKEMQISEVALSVTSSEDAAAKPAKKPLSFWLSLIALTTTNLVVSLDSTALAVAIPRITQELHGTTLEAFWTNICFILAQVVAQPIYTTTSDVLGRKIPLYSAFLLFFVGSVVFATSHSMSVLIVGRTLQGLGGGGLDVLGEIILADMTTLKERPLYLGLYSLPMAAGGVCGPVIGAAFSEYVVWRWIGWINLPIIVIGVVLTFLFMKLRPLETSFRSNLARLDWTGMLLFTVGCTLVALPLSWAGAIYPWSSWRTIVPFVMGFIVLIGLGFYESKPTDAVFPYRIFNNRTSIVSLIGAVTQGALLYSIVLYLPIYFQAVRLEDAFSSAVSVLPTSVIIIASSVLGVVIIETVRKYRPTIVINHILMTVGVGLYALWQVDSSKALLYGLQVIPSIGVGTLFSALNLPMTAAVVSADDMGLASGILVSFRLFGALIGLAICSTVFNNVFEHQINALGQLPEAVSMLRDAREAISSIPLLKAVSHDIDAGVLLNILKAYRTALMAVFLTLAGIGAVGFVASGFMKELSMEREDLGRQQLVEDNSS